MPGRASYLRIDAWIPIFLINTLIMLNDSVIYNRLILMLNNYKTTTQNKTALLLEEFVLED